MAFNLWCKNHMDENCEHLKDCTVCDNKGNAVSDDREVICPMSEQLLKVMGEQMAGGYLKMSGMTPDQRKQILKKRSTAHFKKEGEEVKRQMIKDTFKKKNL